MTIFDEMEAKKNTFTKTDNEIYATIKKFSDDVATNRINEIVSIFGISQPALTRFAKKLGYSGFTEFQFAYKNDLQNLKEKPKKTHAQVYGDLFSSIENSISKEEIHSLAKRMISSHIIYTAGASIAQIPASYIFSIGQITGWFTAIQCSTHEIPSYMQNDDVFILFSAYSGSAFKSSMERFHGKETQPYKILITFNPKHSLRKEFDMIFVLPAVNNSSSAIGTAVTAEPISFLFFIDLLVDEITRIRRNDDQAK